MKFLTTIHNLKNARKLLKTGDGLVVGLKGFSTRETSLLSASEFKEISALSKSLNKEIYISLKPLLFNNYIDNLKEVFNVIKDEYYSGVIVGDIGYYYLLDELGIKNIIYNPETLITNFKDLNYYIDAGLKGAFLAKEIKIKDIVKIAENKKGKLFITAHGHLNMFYSKRKLLESYFTFVNIKYDYKNKSSLRLEELKRKGKYPIIEDEFGTHVFRNNISTVIEHINELENIDYFLIDTLFKDDSYAIDVLKMFKENYSKDEQEKLMNKYKEKWDDGFLTTKTTY